jgi:hypothetical protein
LQNYRKSPLPGGLFAMLSAVTTALQDVGSLKMSYQKVTIDQLQPGSYVVKVLEQTGELEIKHAGWVRSRQSEEQVEACVDLRKYGLDVRNYL